MNVNDPRLVKACEKDPDCDVPFHQPGSAAGFPGFKNETLKSCPEMYVRIRGENPTIIPTTFQDACPNEMSKIALVIDADEDYHFFRQDINGWWSHKPGGLKVTNKDASRRPIYDPQLADRNYTDKDSTLNYDTFCSYYCVPRNRHVFMKAAGGRRLESSVSSSSRAILYRSSTRRLKGPMRRETRRNPVSGKGHN